MKRKYLYTLALIFLMSLTCFAQKRTVRQTSKVSTEAKENINVSQPYITSSDLISDRQKSDEAISKEMIRKVSAVVKDYITNGQITEAHKVIQSNMAKCKALNDSKLCEAGLNFHTGYLLQETAKLEPTNMKAHQHKAIGYYEKVLDAYPNNKSALNNLIKLNTARINNKASVKRVMVFLEQYPSETVHYFLRMGDLFRADKNFELACDFYRKAYQKDSRSERACDAMVSLYTNNDFSCAMAGNVREFALDCKMIGLPNYSEELLRKELTLAVKDQELKKALESMILWSHVLAENSWLFPEKITRLIHKLFPENAVLSTSDKQVKSALMELANIAESDNVNAMNDLKFWEKYSPSVLVHGDWNRVTPMNVLLKILYSKGELATFKNDYNKAEDYWQAALERSHDYDKAFFTVVASDLAKIYHSQPKMDPSDKKLNALVVELFNMKGAAYQANDLQMIRNYHMTLGAIFYDKKKWEGGYATNAKFQLERAVSNRFGPIINPKLRKMLGDVHSNLGETEAAVDAYGQSILDYLSLDRIKEAEDLHAKTKTTKTLNTTQIKKYEAVGGIINWRKEQASPNNAVLKGTMPLSSYLDDASKAEIKAIEYLPKDFVQVQFFKGLSDLGSQLGDNREQEQQIIYANALNKVKEGKNLSSEQDYYRVIKANNSLSQSLEEPKKLETMQMYTKKDLSYNTETSKVGYTVYRIPTLNKEIKVPTQLFKLNDQLQNDYKKTNTTKLIKYKLNKENLELKQIERN